MVREAFREATDDGTGRMLVVRLDWRSLIPVVILVGGVWLIGRIWETLLLLTVSLILAGALAPLLGRLERRGMGRGTAIGIILIGLLVVLGAVGALVLPALAAQIQEFVTAEPALQAQLADRIAAFGPLAGQADAIRGAKPTALLAPLAADALGYAGVAAEAVVLTLTVVVMTLYLLSDQERIRGFVFALLPRVYHIRVARILLDMGVIVGGYMRGQAVTSLAMGAVVFVALAATGIPNPLALAAFAALADLIPLVGGFLVLIPVTVAALVHGPVPAAIVFAVILGYQQIEGHILIPRIYGQTLRLSPLAVVVALLVGGQLLGIIGALLALPLAAGLRVLVEDLRIELPGELPGEASDREREEQVEETYVAEAAGSSAFEAAELATAMAVQVQEETVVDTGVIEQPVEERGDPPLTPPNRPNPAR
jgi:predicted PurR-regulated permease PerM